MDDIGLEGTPVNDRSFSDEYLTTALQKTQNIAQLMDRLGYDALSLIHRRTACRRPAEETKGCASESGIMVL